VSAFTESVVEQAAPAWLEAAGWQVRNGAAIAPDVLAVERRDYGDCNVGLDRRATDAEKII